MDRGLGRFVVIVVVTVLVAAFVLGIGDSRSVGLLANPPVGGGSSATGVGGSDLLANPPVGGGSSATGIGDLGLLANPPVGGGSSAT
ncbi:MAG TPA: hypothetical protein G4O00_04950 [Thermoflexia bacterium]|nr:hypothetical protein [Thermoflexia bacterium]